MPAGPAPTPWGWPQFAAETVARTAPKVAPAQNFGFCEKAAIFHVFAQIAKRETSGTRPSRSPAVYISSPADWRAPEDAMDGVRQTASMFCGHVVDETHGPEVFHVDFHNLAYLFFYTQTFLPKADLPLADREELGALVAQARTDFCERFPHVFPIHLVHLAFDGLLYVATQGDPVLRPQTDRKEAYSAYRRAQGRADWLKNSLHNVYLQQTAFRGCREVQKRPGSRASGRPRVVELRPRGAAGRPSIEPEARNGLE